MDRLPAFITVRTASSRLPKKCLLPFGDVTVLEHVVNRAKFYKFAPILCTTIDPSDDVLEELAGKLKVKIFRGSIVNKLKRWLDCCIYFKLNQFHTIDADDPFFDGEMVRKSFKMLDAGYDMVYPSKYSSSGGATVGFSLTKDILIKVVQMTEKDADTEMCWAFLEKVAGVRSVVVQENLQECPRVRLTLDYEEDYWLLVSMQRILSSFALRQDVHDFLLRNPDFHNINWFRNAQWKQQQEEKTSIYFKNNVGTNKE